MLVAWPVCDGVSEIEKAKIFQSCADRTSYDRAVVRLIRLLNIYYGYFDFKICFPIYFIPRFPFSVGKNVWCAIAYQSGAIGQVRLTTNKSTVNAPIDDALLNGIV